jgi:hypothetical protein
MKSHTNQEVSVSPVSANQDISAHGQGESLAINTIMTVDSEEGSQEDSKLRQGEAIIAGDTQYKENGGEGDFFILLETQSKKASCSKKTYQRSHLRNLAKYRTLWGNLGGLEGNAPQTSMTNYLAVSANTIPLDMQRELLIRAQEEKLSVNGLKQLVKQVMGNSQSDSDEQVATSTEWSRDFIHSLSKASVGLTKLISLISENQVALDQDQIGKLAGLDQIIKQFQTTILLTKKVA